MSRWVVSRWLLGRARWHLDACVRCASRVRCCGAFLPSVAAAPRWWGFVTRQWSVVLLWGVVSASCVSCFRRSAASSHAFDRVAAKAAGFSKTWQKNQKKTSSPTQPDTNAQGYVTGIPEGGGGVVVVVVGWTRPVLGFSLSQAEQYVFPILAFFKPFLASLHFYYL